MICQITMTIFIVSSGINLVTRATKPRLASSNFPEIMYEMKVMKTNNKTTTPTTVSAIPPAILSEHLVQTNPRLAVYPLAAYGANWVKWDTVVEAQKIIQIPLETDVMQSQPSGL